MRAIAFALLLAVFIRHESAFWLADVTGFTPAAVNYILGGIYEMVLAAVITLGLLACKKNIWRDLGLAAMFIAFIEGGQIAGCRLLIADIRSVPANVNLCDHIVGFPLGHVMMTLYVLVIAWSVRGALRSSYKK